MIFDLPLDAKSLFLLLLDVRVSCPTTVFQGPMCRRIESDAVLLGTGIFDSCCSPNGATGTRREGESLLLLLR